MKSFGVNITYMGGETADVGDVVRTIAVNGTMTSRWPKPKLITNEKIKPGNVIVGLAGFGKADYEDSYNSGIASNGLTSARHDMLEKFYAGNYRESFDNSLDDSVVYIGPHRLRENVQYSFRNEQLSATVGELLLSPTRTFAPILKELLEDHFEKINGLIHCSGGGQTKCLKYVPDNVRVVKDNLFEPPVIFKLIQQASRSDDKEMYQVFNMGCRLEIYTQEKNADEIISTTRGYGIDAQVIGRVEEGKEKMLLIKSPSTTIEYKF